MTQPQQQRYTPGEIVDHSRTKLRSRAWPAELATWTATVAGVAATGTYSFDINGITISYDATVPPDTDNTIAQGLGVNFDTNTEALRLAFPSVATNVVTVQEYTPGAGFSLTNAVVPGGATLTLADTTVANGELLLGLGVALDTAGTIRKLTTGDTAAALFGITAESTDIAPNSGSLTAEDHYDEGAQVSLVYRGQIPVRVEEAIAIGDGVFVRVTAAGAELAGAFRTDDGGGDAVQITNARWLEPSYTDSQGRLVAMLEINLP
jgi:hypothetical protein